MIVNKQIIDLVCDADIYLQLKDISVRSVFTIEEMIQMDKEIQRIVKWTVGGSRENPKRRFE